MKREEELDWLYRLRSKIYVYMPREWIPMNNALDMAIKDVEQQPSDDCVEKLEQIEQIVARWNNDASHSFEDMCKINGILKG